MEDATVWDALMLGVRDGVRDTDEVNDGVGWVCVGDTYSSDAEGVKLTLGVLVMVVLYEGVGETDGVNEAEKDGVSDGVKLALGVNDAEAE